MVEARKDGAMAGTVRFRFRWQISPDGSHIYPGKNELRLRTTPAVLGRFEADETSPSGWVVVAETAVEFPPRLFAAMEAIADRRLPHGSDRTKDQAGNVDRWLRREAEVLPSTVLNVDLSTRILNLRDELRSEARRCYELVRWVTNARATHRPFLRGRCEFSLDGQMWHSAPSEPPGKPFDLRADWGIQLDSLPWNELSSLAARGQEEPVGHSLIREASSLRREAPRAAVVLGAAAAETALKSAISTLAPDAAFLVDKLQSPSPSVLLNDYLPTLTSKAPDPNFLMPPPKVLRRSIHWLSETRNRVVHSRNQILQFPDLPHALVHVRDLVWLLDYHCGHAWAENHISNELRSLA